MADEKKAAATTAKETAPSNDPITGARLVSISRGAMDYPAAIYRGDKPARNSILRLTLANGVT